MNTRMLRVDPRRPDPAAVEAAAAALRAGELVVFPTETVYGVAARADRPEAVQALKRAKGRDADKPLTVHLPAAGAPPASRWHRFGDLPPAALRLLRRRIPGPLTLVLRELGRGWTGFRVPDDPVAEAVLAAVDAPVVASSANAAGEEPAVTGTDAAIFAAGRAAVCLDAGPTRLRAPSTVVRVPDEGTVEILREGAVPAADVLVDAARQVLMVCTGNLCRSPLAEGLYRTSLARRLRCGPGDLLARGRAVLSAGTAAVPGHPATPETVDAGRVRGIDLRRHRSRTLTLRLLDAADRVFVMERAQRERILEFVAESAGKVDLLDPRGGDVPDPFGRGVEAYARTAEILERAVEARVAEES